MWWTNLRRWPCFNPQIVPTALVDVLPQGPCSKCDPNVHIVRRTWSLIPSLNINAPWKHHRTTAWLFLWTRRSQSRCEINETGLSQQADAIYLAKIMYRSCIDHVRLCLRSRFLASLVVCSYYVAIMYSLNTMTVN